MGDPSISVLVTAYGRTRFLQDSLESVFRQDFPPSSYEVVLVSNLENALDIVSAAQRAVARKSPED